jgi:soluble lytic murein transglycosylase-like protein
MKVLLVLLTISSVFAKDIVKSSNRSIASMKVTIRKEQAKELLGKRYNTSTVADFENRAAIETYIYDILPKYLPKKHRKNSRIIAKAIIDESFRNELDPFFVMAVIEGESSFNPEAKGPVGEIGMMQIRSSTGKWMAEMVKMKWNGKETLKDPVKNIKLGTAYLKWLRSKFDGHGQLYIAAYNMGPGNVKSALRRNKWPKDYAIHVMKRYLEYYNKLQANVQDSLKAQIQQLSSMHQDMDLVSL